MSTTYFDFQSCTNKTGFLLTQMPLPNTVTDFWRLVYDQHVCNVVMLNNHNEDNEVSLLLLIGPSVD